MGEVATGESSNPTTRPKIKLLTMPIVSLDAEALSAIAHGPGTVLEQRLGEIRVRPEAPP